MDNERNGGATEEVQRDVCFSCSKWMSGFTQKGRARVEGLSESTTIPLSPWPPCLGARRQRLLPLCQNESRWSFGWPQAETPQVSGRGHAGGFLRPRRRGFAL